MSEVREAYHAVDLQNKENPECVIELWSGWFSLWGQQRGERETSGLLQVTRELLVSGASLSFYMFAGGTNFGFWAGQLGGPLVPVITSYGMLLYEHYLNFSISRNCQ